MLFKLPVKPRSEVLTTSATLNPLRFTNPEFTHWTATTSGQTHTLPTASLNLAGYVMGFANVAAASVTLSGAFLGGSSLVVEAGQGILLMCVPTSGTTFKWMSIGSYSAFTDPTAEAIADAVGAMFTGNTETGIAATYQDSDNTIDLVVSYGTTAATACEGNDARLPTAQEKLAFISFYRTGLTGGTANDLDGIAYASCTNGMRAHVKTAGVLYVYLFDSSSASVEASPTVIKPDDAGASNGRWILQTIPGASQSYGTSATTACVGNDGRLPTAGEKSALAALVGSVNWQDWAPTIASSPAVDATVARYQRVGNKVNIVIDVRGSDGDAWTPSTITLPVAPVDLNAHIPLTAIQKENTSTYTNPLAYIDAETGLNIKFHAASACTNAAPWGLYITGSYEVAAA